MTPLKKAHEVGQLPAVVPVPTDKAQYERDLETLGRIEDERLCFFCSMAALHAQQIREAGL